MKKIECYAPSMANFLKKFNPAKHKYHVFESLDDYPTAVSALGAKFDSAYQYGPLNKKEFSGIFDNLYLVYGNPAVVRKDIETYYSVEKEIIRGYLTVPLIDMMFDEDYFEFEWDMHLGQNFRAHRSDYYRDHFIHQARNMFMMHELLQNYFFSSTMKVLANKHNSKISEYCCLKLSQFMLDKESKEYKLFENIVQSIKEYTTNTSNNFLDDIDTYRRYYDPTNKCRNITQLTADDYAYHYFYKYIIYASSYLCALFHDMGYPICHFLEIRERLSNYNPAMYMITQNVSGSFDNIAAKLGDSLLFTIVSHEEIRKRMNEINASGHHDHGVYSAIAFLLHFYETGACQRLTSEKQCAIELAAIAIYNHTQKYACSESTKNARKCSYYQPMFKQNPISFLLHFCDDLEEWDRRYFEISDASAYSICSSCHGVLIPHEMHKGDLQRGEKYKNIWKTNLLPVEQFNCFCKSSEKNESYKCFRRQTFNKRQIYLVTTTPKVSFELNQLSQALHAEIHYDLFRLLQMSHINQNYAKFRLKDLYELKCRLHDQKFKLQCDKFGFDDIYIDSFMTSNPILIKIKILEEYIHQRILKALSQKIVKDPKCHVGFRLESAKKYRSKIDLYLNEYEITDFWSQDGEPIGDLTVDDCVRRIIELMDRGTMSVILKKDLDPSSKDTLCIKTKLHQYLMDPIVKSTINGEDACRLDFYIALLYLSVKKRNGIQIVKNNKEKELIDIFRSTKDDYYNRLLSALIEDCLYQYSRERKSSESVHNYIIKLSNDEKKHIVYHNIYTPDDSSYDMYDIVNKYCHADSVFNKYYENNANHYIGYFGDLFYFELLNDRLYQ